MLWASILDCLFLTAFCYKLKIWDKCSIRTIRRVHVELVIGRGAAKMLFIVPSTSSWNFNSENSITVFSEENTLKLWAVLTAYNSGSSAALKECSTQPRPNAISWTWVKAKLNWPSRPVSRNCIKIYRHLSQLVLHLFTKFHANHPDSVFA